MNNVKLSIALILIQKARSMFQLGAIIYFIFFFFFTSIFHLAFLNHIYFFRFSSFLSYHPP